jgi:hypothetical protein
MFFLYLLIVRCFVYVSEIFDKVLLELPLKWGLCLLDTKIKLLVPSYIMVKFLSSEMKRAVGTDTTFLSYISFMHIVWSLHYNAALQMWQLDINIWCCVTVISQDAEKF